MLKTIYALLLFLWAGTAYSHSLTLTTAGVSIRNHTHLSIRLEYDPLLLWQRVNAPEDQVPAGLAVFVNMPEPAFAQGYAALQQHLRDTVRIAFAGKALDSPQFRFPSAADLRAILREVFMRQAFSAQGDHPHDHDHDHHGHRDHYQTVNIDGFLPEGAASGGLAIHFPATLGEVMVTFSRPQTQMLKPNQDGADYHYQLESCVP